MRDEERIHMYYKYGLLDWRSEQQPMQETVWGKIIKRLKAFKITLWSRKPSVKTETKG